MEHIMKYSIVENKYEEVTMFTSAFTEKMNDLGIDPKDALVKICSECKKDELEEAIVKSAKTHYVASGFYLDSAAALMNGSAMRSNPFAIFAAGSSDIRKATDVWVRQDLWPVLGKWAMCGLQTKDMKLAINKYMAYIGLLFSASKRFEDVFGPRINIRRVAIIKDVDVTVDAIVDFVAVEKGISRKQARKLIINAFDGFGIIRKSLTKGESCTLRGPWLKAFVQAIDWHKLVAFCISRGIKLTFNDL